MYLPSTDAVIYTGYTVVGYCIYIFYMVFLFLMGQFGKEYSIPFQKQMVQFVPLLRIIIEE